MIFFRRKAKLEPQVNSGVHSDLAQFVSENEKDFDIPYRPSEKPEEILRQSGLPYLPIVGFEMPVQEMYAEAKKLENAAIPHRAYGESHRGWKSLVLHGISSAHTQGAEQYGMNPDDPSIYQWTDVARLCPVTTEFFQQKMNYDSFQRVRFMYLEPGGYVLPHQDADKYFLGPVNIALNNPPGCRFIMEKVGVVPFQPGTINKLALVNRHAVLNESEETRIHVIVHGSPNYAHWSAKYVESYGSLVRKESRLKSL